MEIIKTHITAFLVLLLAMICLLLTIIVTAQKYEDNEVVDNSTLKIDAKTENIKTEGSYESKEIPIQGGKYEN